MTPLHPELPFWGQGRGWGLLSPTAPTQPHPGLCLDPTTSSGGAQCCRAPCQALGLNVAFCPLSKGHRGPRWGTRSPGGRPAPRSVCPPPGTVADHHPLPRDAPLAQGVWGKWEDRSHELTVMPCGSRLVLSPQPHAGPFPRECWGGPCGARDPHHPAGAATPRPCASAARTTQPSAADSPLFLHPIRGQRLTRRHHGVAGEGDMAGGLPQAATCPPRDTEASGPGRAQPPPGKPLLAG